MTGINVDSGKVIEMVMNCKWFCKFIVGTIIAIAQMMPTVNENNT